MTLQRHWPYALTARGAVLRGTSSEQVGQLGPPWAAMMEMGMSWSYQIADTPQETVVVAGIKLSEFVFVAAWGVSDGRCLWRKLIRGENIYLETGAGRRLVHILVDAWGGGVYGYYDECWVCPYTGESYWYTMDCCDYNHALAASSCTEGAYAGCIALLSKQWLSLHRGGKQLWRVDVALNVGLDDVTWRGDKIVVAHKFGSSPRLNMYAAADGAWLGLDRRGGGLIHNEYIHCFPSSSASSGLVGTNDIEPPTDDPIVHKWVPSAGELARCECADIDAAVAAIDDLPCESEAVGLVRAVLVGFVAEDARLNARGAF